MKGKKWFLILAKLKKYVNDSRINATISVNLQNSIIFI